MPFPESNLARRIQALAFDDPTDALTFSARLARENRWSRDYTARVIVEYRRFLLLAATARHPVTPSDAVDQAWHLHVLNTPRYRQFCEEVLGRVLDHVPTRGGRSQQAKFTADYENTRVSYLWTFGEFPPGDVWPGAARRFGDDLAFARVNLADFWTVRRPAAWRWLARRFRVRVSAPAAKIAAAALGVAAMGCEAVPLGGAHVTGPQFLRALLGVWLVSLVFAFVVRALERRAAPIEGREPELDAYEVAFLAGGERKAVDAALTALIARDAVRFDRDRRLLHGGSGSLQGAAHWLERRVHAIVATGECALSAVRAGAKGCTEPLSTRTDALGLTGADSWLPFALACLTPALGALRVVDGASRQKPVGILVSSCLLTLFVAFGAFWPRRRLTDRGEAALERLRERHRELQAVPFDPEDEDPSRVPLTVALFETTALAALDAPGWSEALAEDDRGGSGGGCGGEGGGGDGGCGGCGGCGG